MSISKYDLFILTELLKQIDEMADDYLSGVRDMLGEKRKEHLNGIQKLFSQSKKFGDEKVQLALQTYEMVIHAFYIHFKLKNINKYLIAYWLFFGLLGTNFIID